MESLIAWIKRKKGRGSRDDRWTLQESLVKQSHELLNLVSLGLLLTTVSRFHRTTSLRLTPLSASM